MERYSILGKELCFNDSALRFFDVQNFLWKVERNANVKFDEWYASRSNINSVLYGYEGFSEKLVCEEAIQPLFETNY